MNTSEALILLKWSHVGLRSVYVVYSWILFVWATLDLVEHFSNSLFHVSFWLGLEILYIVMCSISVGYGLEAIKGDILLDTKRSINMAGFCMFLTVLILGKNITHLTFVSIELGEGVTPLATQNYWFLVIFLILLICLILMNIGAIFQYYWFRSHLRGFEKAYKNQKMK